MSLRIRPDDLRVYAIVDPRSVELDAKTLAETLYGAGIPIVQLRAKGATDDQLRVWCADFVAVAADCDGLFILNDRVDLALETGADGVHLGPQDMSIETARAMGPELIIGASAGETELAQRFELQGADYLGCGAVWDAAPSKANASSPRGLDMIREISRTVSIPIVGIGGITIERAPLVVEAGASGVAVIRAILGEPDIGEAAAKLLQTIGR